MTFDRAAETRAPKVIDPARPINCWFHRLYADWRDDTCRNRVIQVVVYPTTEQLRHAASRYAKANGKDDDFSDADAVFHPSPFRSKYNRRTKQWDDTTPPFAGVMRLSQQRLTTEVIAHEATHAALHITRLHDWGKTEDSNGRADFGDNCEWPEEAFAYLLGELVHQVVGIAWRIDELDGLVHQ